MKCLPLLVLLSMPVLAQLPEDARKLEEAYQKESHRLKLAYLQKLDALAAKYRTDSKDQEANAIEKMIAELEGKKPDPKAEPSPEDFLRSLIGVWRRDYDKGIFNFTSTKEGVFGGNRKFTIAYDSENQRVILVGDNWVNYLTPAPNPDVVNGSEEGARGKRYKIERVK